MKHFFKSNKSQSSIDRYNPSREGSPTHPEPPAHNAAYPPPAAQTAPLAQRYPAVPGSSQHDGASDAPEQRRYHEAAQDQTHPAHHLSRSQSNRLASGGDAQYNTTGRPSVHIIGPSSPTTAPPIYEEQRYPPPPPSQLQPGPQEKERRKSKRSIFGLHSSSKESKEPNSPSSSRAPGRTGSLLRKTQLEPQGQQSLTTSGPYPQASPGNQAHQQQSQEGFYQSQDSLTDSEDRAPNERFYQGNGQFDQSQSQAGVSPEGQRYSQQSQQQYQGGPERRSEESIDTYLQYQQHQQQQQLQQGLDQDSAAFDPRQIRPPSQLSLLGPPSPGTQSADSRPSSATNISHQSRFSTQSAAPIGPLSQQQQQQHIAMARGDPPPNGLRDQISQQRDPRLDPGHPQYGQDPRSRVPQHAEQGRSTPPPRSREDIGNMDFQTLLQRHEELRE